MPGGDEVPALGIAVAPDLDGEDALVAFVDQAIAHGLSRQVDGDFMDAEVVLREDPQPVLHVVVVVRRPNRVQVIPPAGDLETVVAPLAGRPGDLLEG